MSISDANNDMITPLEAVHLLSPFVGGDKKAKKLIADRLFDGGVEAVADWMFNQIGRGPMRLLPPLPFSLPDDLHNKLERASGTPEITKPTLAQKVFAIRVRNEDEDSVEVPCNVWSQSSDYKRDQKGWNWRYGMFTVSSALPGHDNTDLDGVNVPRAPTPRFAAHGVRFKKSDITKLMPAFANNAPLPMRPKRRATKVDLEPFLIELIALGVKGETTKLFGAYGLKGWNTKVSKWLAQRLIDNDLELGETSIKNKVSEIANAIKLI